MSFVDPRTPEEQAMDAKKVTRQRWFYRLLFAPVIALLLASLVSIMWPWSEIEFTQFKPLQKSYSQGDVVKLQDEFCWGPGLTGDGQAFANQREFISVEPDGSLGPTHYGVGSVGFDFWFIGADKIYLKENDWCAPSSVRIQIPFVLPPGRWVVRYTASYDPTPLPGDTQKKENTSIPFLVTPSDTLILGGDTTPAG